jgi:hypothetical protein
MTREAARHSGDCTKPLPPEELDQLAIPHDPAPCDGCSYAIACVKRQLACRAFAEYVRTGRSSVRGTLRLRLADPICGCFVTERATTFRRESMTAKASAANSSKRPTKRSIKRRHPSPEPRTVAAATEELDESESLPSALDSPPSVAERLQTQRDQLFKAISIVQCCRNATATKLVADDLEYMIPAFETVCDLLDSAAAELDTIMDERDA